MCAIVAGVRVVRQCGISVTRCSGLAHILCPFSSCPGEDAAGSEARAHTHTHKPSKRERMLLERSESFHCRQSVPVAHSRENNANQPRIFSFPPEPESWNQASDHPCLVAFHRTRARARTHEIFPSVWQFSRAGRTWQPPRRTALLPKKNQSVRWTTVGKVWGFVMGSGSVGGCSVEKIYRAGRGGRPIYSQRVRSSLWKIDGEREKERRLKGAVKRM